MKQVAGWSLSTSPESAVSGSEVTQTGYPGSIQQVLQQNVGYYVACEFLVGADHLVRKEGTLHAVNSGWMSIFIPTTAQYVVCDIYAIKFVTFYPPGTEPMIPGP